MALSIEAFENYELEQANLVLVTDAAVEPTYQPDFYIPTLDPLRLSSKIPIGEVEYVAGSLGDDINALNADLQRLKEELGSKSSEYKAARVPLLTRKKALEIELRGHKRWLAERPSTNPARLRGPLSEIRSEIASRRAELGDANTRLAMLNVAYENGTSGLTEESYRQCRQLLVDILTRERIIQTEDRIVARKKEKNAERRKKYTKV